MKRPTALEVKKFVIIPCPSSDLPRLKHYCEKYNMKVKKRIGGGDTYEVSNYNDLDLYWLGANMAMPAFNNGMSKHI